MGQNAGKFLQTGPNTLKGGLFVGTLACVITSYVYSNFRKTQILPHCSDRKNVSSTSKSTLQANCLIKSDINDKQFIPRLLEEDDYQKNFLKMLALLTTVDKVSFDMFKKRFVEQNNSDTQFSLVIEDKKMKKVIATATLVINQKFTHQCGQVGLIEDVVVDKNYQGKGLGKKIVNAAKALAQEKKCYKVILNCPQQKSGFYKKLGFQQKEVQMALYFTSKLQDKCPIKDDINDKQFIPRLLEEGDYHKNFLNMLELLTTVGKFSFVVFKKRFVEQNNSDTQFSLVIEDEKMKKVIATATLVMNQKFTHQCGQVGLIEDVVVDKNYRGKGLGKKIVNAAKALAQEKNCYKVILNCTQQNTGFYKKLGFKQKEVQMALYFTS